MKSRRAYRMRARADAAAETGRRIVSAMQALFAERPYDAITLEDVAARAGVTLQTVLRRFGSKAGLLAAAAADGSARVAAQRALAPDDLPGAVRNLFDHYEEWGRVALRLLEQEERIPEIGALTRDGRRFHADWVARVFAAALRRRPAGRARRVRHAQLVALTDVYVWKVLRRDRALSRAAAERALLELLQPLCAQGAR